MNETLSFAGWRPGNPDQIIPWKEKFDEEYSDGGQLTLLSKEIYQAEADEDMPAFEYRYIIKAMDLQAFGSDQKTICFRLYMCPLPQYWKPEVLKDLSEDNSADWFFEDAVNSDVLPYIGEEYLNYTDNDVLPDENQAWNQLGNTGWDLLEHILNGKDYIKAALSRLNNCNN